MSKTRAILTVTLLAMTACVSEQTAEHDRLEDLAEVDVGPSDADPRETPTRLPGVAIAAPADDRPPAPVTSIATDLCAVVTAAHLVSMTDALARSLTLMDRDIADGLPVSLELAIEARSALKTAYTHAEVARGTLLAGPLSFDGDAAVTIPAEGAAVRAELHEVIAQVSIAIDRAVQRASDEHDTDRVTGVAARDAAYLAGKILGRAHELRGRAVDCELGLWR